MILGAVAEGFELLMIVPIASIAINGGTTGFAQFLLLPTSWTSDQRFLAALALFVAAMGVRSILLYARDLLLAKLQADYDADLKLRAAATLAHRGWLFASSIGQAGMQSLLLNDVPRVGRACSYMQSMAVAAAMLAVQLALAMILSPPLTLVAIAFIAVSFLLSMGLTRRGARSGRAMGESLELSSDAGFRIHSALETALAQGTVDPFLNEYRHSLRGLTSVVTEFTRDYAFTRYAAALGAAVAAAFILFVGDRLLGLPFAVLVASLALFARMSAPAQSLQLSIFRLSGEAPAFAAIQQRLGKLDAPTGRNQHRPESLDWTNLDFRDARFEYGGGLGLRGADFRLSRGQWLGIEGPSGGKTTLVDLVAGLIAPQRGSIWIDGVRLEGDALWRWRAGIAYVGQEGSVFDDSVRGNLLAEGAAATEEQIWRVLDMVGLADRVRAFRNGLDESVGDRGSHLSGGERQRLVLGRALLRRPSLLILDEATAALDPAAEAELLARVRKLQPRPAALIVAHRQSTLNHCDSVVAIQHGEVSPPDPFTAAE